MSDSESTKQTAKIEETEDQETNDASMETETKVEVDADAEIPLEDKEPDDEEYEHDDDEEMAEDEEEEEEVEEEYSADDKEIIIAPPVKRKRGRPPKHRPPVPQYDDDMEEDEEGRLIKRNHDDSGTSTPRMKGRRGRKPANAPEGTLVSDSGRVLKVVDDEYNASEDEEGETKISKDGELQDGRQYRVRTFPVKGKGNRLYMLSTEPARCMGFRDSYLLFQKHRTLFKVVVDQDEKFDLIEREIIPHSYKGRVIGLVTARSVFREFGAKIIVGGKHITDDYYCKKIRAEGKVVEGELAEPADKIPSKGKPYNKDQFVAWHGASNVYHTGPIRHVPAAAPVYEPVELKSMKALKQNGLMSEENWMLQHAHAIREVDTLLLQNRYALARGLRDPYTGTTFVPGLTQPSHVEIRKLVQPAQEVGKRKKLQYDTVMSLPHMAKKTGLKDVPKEVFAGCVDEKTLKAIMEQQEYERTLV